jgi:hypothetical protein
MFANVCHFHPSLVFAGKAGACQRGAPYRTKLYFLSPSLPTKYLTSVEKRLTVANFLAYLTTTKKYCRKKFYSTGPWALKGL